MQRSCNLIGRHEVGERLPANMPSLTCVVHPDESRPCAITSSTRFAQSGLVGVQVVAGHTRGVLGGTAAIQIGAKRVISEPDEVSEGWLAWTECDHAACIGVLRCL